VNNKVWYLHQTKIYRDGTRDIKVWAAEIADQQQQHPYQGSNRIF